MIGLPRNGGEPWMEGFELEKPWKVPESWPQAEALFRAQIVAPLLDPLSSPEEKTLWRKWVTTRQHELPNGKQRGVSERTLRRWVAQARAIGFEGLSRVRRCDRGRLRKVKPEWLERAKQLKRELPRRSIPHILRMLESEYEQAAGITPGALWRHLAKEGLGGRRRLEKQGLRRWEALAPGQVWQSDVKYGPFLPDPLRENKRRRTYLIAFLDDYSRYVVHGEWFWAEDEYALELCFQKALVRCGRPARVYVDRGAIYQSRIFRLGCATLGIRHISATAYHAEGKGKIERFWRTMEEEFLLEWDKASASSLSELNEAFWAWLDRVYHQRVHSQTEVAPCVRFAEAALERLDPQKVHEAFLWRKMRTVDKTGVFTLEGNLYQTETELARRRVEVRYHPLQLDRVQIWTADRRWADAVACELVTKRIPRVSIHQQTRQEPTPYLERLVLEHRRFKQTVLSSPLSLSRGEEDV